MFSFYWCCFLARLFSWTFLIFVYQILSFASLLSINLYCCWRGCVSPRLSCLSWPVFHWGFLSLFRNHISSLRFSSTSRSQSSHKSLRFLDCFSALLFSRIAVSWSYQLSQHPPIFFFCLISAICMNFSSSRIFFLVSLISMGMANSTLSLESYNF